MGRPPHEPTDRNRGFVQAAIMGGIPQSEVAAALEISVNTLKKYYAEQIDGSVTRANAAVINTAYQMATSGKCPAMTIFWLKTRLGWRDVNQVDITSNGESINWRDKIDDVKSAKEALRVFDEAQKSSE